MHTHVLAVGEVSSAPADRHLTPPCGMAHSYWNTTTLEDGQTFLDIIIGIMILQQQYQ